MKLILGFLAGCSWAGAVFFVFGACVCAIDDGLARNAGEAVITPAMDYVWLGAYTAGCVILASLIGKAQDIFFPPLETHIRRDLFGKGRTIWPIRGRARF